MNPSLLLRVSAVVMVAFGIPLLFAPNLLIAMYGGPEMNAPGIYNSMLYGGLLIAVAVVNWAVSASHAAPVRPVLLGNLVGNGLGFLVTLVRQVVDPAVPAQALLNVAIFLAFTVLFAMAYVKANPEPVPGGIPAA